MNAPGAGEHPLAKAEAEFLARYFNISFGHALMYGVSHQMTVDSIKPFFAALKKTLETVPTVTVSAERESIFIEGWCVDKIVNARKLTAHFKKGEIQSFSFDKDLSAQHLAAFLEIAAGLAKYPTADCMKKELESRGASGIRINYIVYRKMTADEEVVRKGLAVASPAAAPAESDDPFSIEKLLRDPKAAAGALVCAASGTPRGSQDAASSVAELGKSVRHGADGAFSGGELIEAVLALREEYLNRAVADGAADPVAGEIEKLTHETIIRLVCDEYKTGDVSAKRLAQVLRRMLPDRRELRVLLPLLKSALLSAGMPFIKYVELVNELRGLLDDDGVASSLAAATRDMGVTPDEVLREIKKSPADAARLILLAAELRRTGGDDSALERMLTDYIEQASSRMAVGSADAARPETGRHLGAMLQKIQTDLLDTLKRHGLEQSILDVLSARCAERLPIVLDAAKAEWLATAIESRPGSDPASFAGVIAGTVRQPAEIDAHRDAIAPILERKGLSPEQIQEVFRQASARTANAQIDLPKGVLSSTAIMYFLERECKLSKRYHTPFSLLIISILGRIDPSSGPQALRADERAPFITALLAALKSTLRDIDIIGVPSSAAEAIVFVILPMTDEANTYGLVERLRSLLPERAFTAGGAPTRLTLAVSITGFDFTIMDDKTTFLKAAMAHHRAAEKIKLAGIKE